MQTETKIEHYPGGARMMITLPSERHAEVSAYPPSLAMKNGPKVNWRAYGSVSVEDAKAYAELILEACKVAESMTPVQF